MAWKLQDPELANLIAYVKWGVQHKEMQGTHLGAIKGEQEVKS